MNFIRVKKSFTLIELIIVIILISSAYFLIFSNSNFIIKKDEMKLSLMNIREYLMKNFQYEDNLSFVCIEDNFDCFIRVDGKIDEKLKVEHFFDTVPIVYEYNKEENKIEFEEIKVDNTKQKVIFELTLNSDYKINEFLLDTLDEKVYMFNSIFKEPKLFSSMNEIFDYFNENELEVKDAF